MAEDFKPGYNRCNVHRLVIDMYIKHRLNTVGGDTVEIPNLRFFDKNKRHSDRSAILDLTFPHFAFKRRLISTYIPKTQSKLITVPLEAMLVYHNYANSLKPIPELCDNSRALGLGTAEVLVDHLNYMYGICWKITIEEDTKGRKVVPLFNFRVIDKDDLVSKIAEAFSHVYRSEARFRMELRADSVEIDIAYVDSVNRSVKKEKVLIVPE